MPILKVVSRAFRAWGGLRPTSNEILRMKNEIMPKHTP
jgi:hypothetical protein